MSLRFLDIGVFKAWYKTEVVVDDPTILHELEATEQAIDNTLHRRVSVADPLVSSARSYRSRHAGQWVLVIDDAAEIVSVVDDGTILVAGTDYVAEPLNGLTESGVPRPFHALSRIGRPWSFAGYRPTVTVTARWGWATIPAEIVSGAMIDAADRLANREFRLGLVGVTGDGLVAGQRVNHTVAKMIAHYEHPILSVGLA